MSNIEDDVKILEKFKNNEMQRDKLERDNRCGGWKIGDIYKHLELNTAIQNILAEREQKDKRIKELEEENAILKKASNIAKDVNIEDVTEVMNKSFEEFMSDYISKQVVIDKMEELNKEIKSCDEIDAIFKIKQQQVLQELLGGEK